MSSVESIIDDILEFELYEEEIQTDFSDTKINLVETEITSNPSSFEELAACIENCTDTTVQTITTDDPDCDIEPVKTNNFVNNKDILREIHLSKNNFSEFMHPRYSNYDIITEDIDDLHKPEFIENAKTLKANKMSLEAYNAAAAQYKKSDKTLPKPKMITYKVDPQSIETESLVFRVMTYEHIPLAPGRKKNPKKLGDHYVKLNFCPFKHYVLMGGVAVEVGRSHTKNSEFSISHGCITNGLANIYLLITEKYGQTWNWRNYTYLDEMKSQALEQLFKIGLQFNEFKSDMPFSYFTSVMSHSFTKVLNAEKVHHELRDNLLIDKGMMPSFSKQVSMEHDRKAKAIV